VFTVVYGCQSQEGDMEEGVAPSGIFTNLSFYLYSTFILTPLVLLFYKLFILPAFLFKMCLLLSLVGSIEIKLNCDVNS
jgi:hypothetical protein